MVRKPVASSNLKSVGYDPDKNVLEVEFQSGDVHQYQGVPADHFHSLFNAPSAGSYFHRHIKNKFSSTPRPSH